MIETRERPNYPGRTSVRISTVNTDHLVSKLIQSSDVNEPSFDRVRKPVDDALEQFHKVRCNLSAFNAVIGVG